MNSILMRLGVFATILVGSAGVSSISYAACARGSTDCPILQPSGRSHNEWRYDRTPNRHWDRNDRRHNDRNRHWRGHNRHNGGSFFGFYYDTPSYRYVEPAPVYRYRYRADVLPSAHVNWCTRHYRTYRLSDNTFKPTRNTRRECVSPYWP